MNIQISFKNIDPSESLKEFIQEKSSTLKRYFQGKITIHWTISINKQSKIAHCHILGNNMDYFSEASEEDFKKAIDLTLEKMDKQIRKHKEIVKDHYS